MIIHESRTGTLTLCVMGTILWLSGLGATTRAAEANYDESLVPRYALPDPLRREKGGRIKTTEAWRSERRPELLELFERHVYGRTPGPTKRMSFVVRSVEPAALGGKATRKEVTIRFSSQTNAPELDLLIYLPNERSGPVPVFLGLNFNGNHTVHADPGISLPRRSGASAGGGDADSPTNARGSSGSRWPIETILGRGYGVVTAYYGDLEPDRPGGWREGVRRLFEPNPGSDDYPADAWGAIGAWAWGLSRAMDYLELDREIDADRVALLGHSRLGKTALWAGARDERFAIVISNNSGCGGAALSRRQFGETVARITTVFPHWFCGRFQEYGGREDRLPVDQHQLIALMAPRPVYVASAVEDLWADPRGEFLAALGAEPVYALFGKGGLGVDAMPGADQPVGDTIGYHLRTGKHDVTAYDWEQYLAFADRHLGR